MVLYGLIATFVLGLLLMLFGAGFLGFLALVGSVGGGIYLSVKHPNMLKGP